MGEQLLAEQRENWGSRAGFVLAAIGSAVGLGNLWGFPYKLYSYGGGAFLIPYVISMLLVGIPLLIAEFSLGHLTQRATPEAFGRANRRFAFVGWWQIILSFVIITYYAVILAWCLNFLVYSVAGIAEGSLPWAGKGMEGVAKANSFFFDKYLDFNESFTLGAPQKHIIAALAVTWLAMYLCIFRGVRLVGKVVMWTVPLPWLMLLILAVRGLTLDGAMQGLEYYLEPNWSRLADPATWRWAFGQMFFSMSLAFGIMVTYASFLHRKSDLNNNAAVIGLADMGTSFVAGLAVFATLGGMACATRMAGAGVPVEEVARTGPSLAFVAFPYALAQLPHAAWFSALFFASLLLLGIDSAFSITECVLASVVDKTHWRRGKVLVAITIVGFAAGLAFCTRGGLSWLGTFDDFINGTWGITLTALLECFVLGWLFRLGRLREHANERSDWKVGALWGSAIRIVIPVLLAALFIWSLFDGLRSPTGYLYKYTADTVAVNIPPADKLPPRPVLEVQFVATTSQAAEHTFRLDETKQAEECWRVGPAGATATAPAMKRVAATQPVPASFKAADLVGRPIRLAAAGLTPRTSYRVEHRWTSRPTTDAATGLPVAAPPERQGRWRRVIDQVTTTSRKGDISTGNCAGLILMAVAPVLAILIAALRFRAVRHDEIVHAYEDHRPRGRFVGALAIVLGTGALAASIVAFLQLLLDDYRMRAALDRAEGLTGLLTPETKILLLIGTGVAGLWALLLGGGFVRRCELRRRRASMAPRLGAGLGVLGLGICAGLSLAFMTMQMKFTVTPIVYDNELSIVSWVILGVMLALIVGGLAWCFYRALRGAGAGEQEQVAESTE